MGQDVKRQFLYHFSGHYRAFLLWIWIHGLLLLLGKNSKCYFFKSSPRLCLLSFWESGRRRVNKREKRWCERETFLSCLSYVPDWDRTVNLGMCPDWGSHPQTFGAPYNAPTHWATGQGSECYFVRYFICRQSMQLLGLFWHNQCSLSLVTFLNTSGIIWISRFPRSFWS